MKDHWRRLVAAAVWCLIAVLWAPGAGAQESSDDDVTKRIEELEARVAELEAENADDSRWDTALRAKYTPGRFTVVAGGSYQNKPFTGVDTRYDGVASVRHDPSGLNLTAGATNEKMTRGATATSWIVKLGWLADLVPLGKTAFSADYYRVSDIRVDGDRSTSYGLFAM